MNSLIVFSSIRISTSNFWKKGRKVRYRRSGNRQSKIRPSKLLKHKTPTDHLLSTCKSSIMTPPSSITSIKTTRRTWPSKLYCMCQISLLRHPQSQTEAKTTFETCNELLLENQVQKTWAHKHLFTWMSVGWTIAFSLSKIQRLKPSNLNLSVNTEKTSSTKD